MVIDSAGGLGEDVCFEFIIGPYALLVICLSDIAPTTVR